MNQAQYNETRAAQDNNVKILKPNMTLIRLTNGACMF